MQLTRRARLYLTLQIAGWSAYALINAGFGALSGRISGKFLLSLLLTTIAAAFSSHILRNEIRRRHWFQLRPAQVIALLLIGSLLCGCVITAVGSALAVWVFHFDRLPSWNWINVFPIVFVWSVIVFLWALIYASVHYFETSRQAQLEQLRLQVAAKDAELRSLLSQLNPHFLFNCLNSLRALIIENPARAQTMVDELSSILRYSLRSERSGTVPFEDEVAVVSAYLKLELIRFEDRLKVSFDIDPSSLSVAVPPMLVQTLVENGLKHGIARLAQGGEISVSARRNGRALEIRVVNTGQLQPAAGSMQIGIENARKRLRLIYGDAASLALRNLNSTSVLAEVSVPAAKGSA